MNTKEIELAIANYFKPKQNLIVPNVSWGFGLRYEADLVVVRKSGYAVEVEIKVSKGDLIRDKNKMHGHSFEKFRELYFAIPKKLENHIEHIPERAGIFICEKIKTDNGYYYKVNLLKKAKTNKYAKQLSLQDKYDLARLGTLRIWNLKKKIITNYIE